MTTTPRNAVWVNSTTDPIGKLIGSDFTHVILATFHLNNDIANGAMKILTGITTIYSTNDYSQYVSALNDGQFPQSLQAASAEGFQQHGIKLSDDLSVTVVEPGTQWTLVDNGNGGAQYPIQQSNVWLAINGSNLYSTYDYAQYVTDLNEGTFPEGLREASAAAFEKIGIVLPAVVPVTQVQPSSHWIITDTDNNYTWIIRIQTNSGQSELEIWDYLGVYTPNTAQFWNEVGELISQGMTVLVSVGGGGIENDWTLMGQDVNWAVVLFQELLDTYGLSGVDLDYEGDETSADAQTLASFINTYWAETGGGVIFTMSPYAVTLDFLIGVLQKTKNGTSSGNFVQWLNAQMYEGETNYSADGSGQTFDTTYVQPIQNGNIGISDALPFLVPGWNADPGAYNPYDPTVIAQAISNIRDYYNGASIGGAFVWKLSYISDDVDSWASDMESALGGSSS